METIQAMFIIKTLFVEFFRAELKKLLLKMDSELLQSFVGQSNDDEEGPSRLYQKQDNKEKKREARSETPSTPPPNWGRSRKNVVVIEQKKCKKFGGLALDVAFCDRDRAASCSFGYLDIKQEFKQKSSLEKGKTRLMPDDDACAFLMLGKREIKTGNLESGVKFLSKVL